jgi:hypothetical protein
VAACVAAGAAGAALGCASQGIPPGGPPDKAAPMLVAVMPESGTVRVSPSVVEFRFDEVVSERPRSAASLEKLVVISPSDGTPNVAWGRNRLVVRPRSGWRPNTAYTVTILTGLTDLRGNSSDRRFTTVFSTGSTITGGIVRGVAFDWMAGRAAPGARIEATVGADTLLRWATAADSTGRFALGSLPAETFLIRAWVDQNNNGVREPREAWDTVTIAISDSARHDLYLFPHDTIGARMGEVTITDSVTIRVKFDHGLWPGNPINAAQFRLVRARDSSEIPIRQVLAAALHDSSAIRGKLARDDSLARADTSEKGRREMARSDSLRRALARDSASRAQVEAVRAAHDTTRRLPAPVPAREVPPTEFVIVTAKPMPEEVPLRLFARDVQALMGPARSSDRLIVRRKPAAIDTTRARRRPPPSGRE